MRDEQKAQRYYVQLVSLPEGVQVTRNGKVKYYWYDQITDVSRLRLWNVLDQCKQLVSNPDIHIWRRRFTYATVPLRREFLRQPVLPGFFYAERSNPLPELTEGQQCRVYDADEWQRDNRKEGLVKRYSMLGDCTRLR